MVFFKSPRHLATQHPATLLVGLGNPGRDYAANRHNVGFMALDRLAQDHGFSAWKKTKGGELAEGIITPPPLGERSGGGRDVAPSAQNGPPPHLPPNGGGIKVLLLKPLTYMNLSGECAGQVARFYKIAPASIIAIHDELDLPLAKIRVKTGGGHGGHNGLKSLDAHLGKDYRRLRFGIAHPGDKDLVSDYVLSDFTKAERTQVDATLADISRHIDLLLQGNDAEFMNRISLASCETPTTNHESRT